MQRDFFDKLKRIVLSHDPFVYIRFYIRFLQVSPLIPIPASRKLSHAVLDQKRFKLFITGIITDTLCIHYKFLFSALY